MKILFIIAAFLLPAFIFAQVPPIASTGFGEIKINMPLTALNKLLAKPIKANQAQLDSNYYDTVNVVYKNTTLQVYLYKTYVDDNNKNTVAVYGLRTTSADVKTRSGIGLGADKFDVIRKLDGFSLNLYPDWHYADTPEKKRYSLVQLNDGENGTILTMYFDNNKLYEFEVRIFEGC